jgi:hypothetical protein
MEVIEITVHEKAPNWKKCVTESELAEGFQALLVTVCSDQPISHPLAVRTQKLLAHLQRDESGRVYPKSGAARHVSVTERSLPRALHILDALFHAFEGQGYTVKWPKEEGSRLSVVALGEEMLLYMREIVKTKPHAPTEQELARQKRGLWVDMPRWDYVRPPGVFTFESRASISPDSLACARAHVLQGVASYHLRQTFGSYFPRAARGIPRRTSC